MLSDWPFVRTGEPQQRIQNSVDSKSPAAAQSTAVTAAPTSDWSMWTGRALHQPAMDIVTRENEYQITCDVPGVDKKEVSVELHQRENGSKYLTIKGERKEEHKQEDTERGYYSESHRYGKFERSVAVPSYVTQADIQATQDNGVLKIVIPRRDPAKTTPSAKIPVS